MEKVHVAVVGGGVVGLAAAYEIARDHPDHSILLIEKNDKAGQETSSRSSEVIHAGLYYPTDTLKTRLCVAGNSLLYSFCERYNIPYKRIGKVMAATCEEEKESLEILYRQGKSNGCVLGKLDLSQLKKIEPGICAVSGIMSVNTGIIDSDRLVQTLFRLNLEQGIIQLMKTPLTSIKLLAGGEYLLETPREEIIARTVVNCAGLNSAEMASMAGLDTDRFNYRLYYCKGDYYSLPSQYQFNHLVYPVPSPHFLGIHLTQDIARRQRLGPNAYYVENIDYCMQETYKYEFYSAARRFLPDLDIDDLRPDYTGIRPKLQGPGQPFRDFIISEEQDKGFPGLINLIGIESPGLTACLAIGQYVSSLID